MLVPRKSMPDVVLPRPSTALDLAILERSHKEKAAAKRHARGIRAVWIICLLVLAISAVSALPIMGISIVQTGNLGNTLLQEVAEQQFNVMHTSIQAALDEGDFWADFMEGWLRHRPPPLTASGLKAEVKMLMLTFLSSVARRVGGMCLHFVNEISMSGGWQYCGVRTLYEGNLEVHWDDTINTSMYEQRTDKYFNVLEPVVSWPLPASDYTKPQFQWPDGKVEWEQPVTWLQEETVITEVIQHRMVKVGNASILNRMWMEETDWARVLRENLNASMAINPHQPPIAFMFSDAGMLITSTCGATNRNGAIINANDSDCDLMQQSYAALGRDGYLASGSGFYRANLPSGPYLLGLRQIRTTRSGLTPLPFPAPGLLSRSCTPSRTAWRR
eukprot:EG_transcript_8584